MQGALLCLFLNTGDFFLLVCIESLTFQTVKFKKADLENTVTFIFEC